jgi:hypothetical protein
MEPPESGPAWKPNREVGETIASRLYLILRKSEIFAVSDIRRKQAAMAGGFPINTATIALLGGPARNST